MTIPARARFPLGYFDAKEKSWEARWAEERTLQEDVGKLRSKLRRVTGEEEPLMGKLVEYGPIAAGLQAAWDLCARHVTNLAGAWDAAALNGEVKKAMRALGLPHSVNGFMALVRTEEFEAFRRDVEFMRCLASQKAAFDLLPNVMAHTMAREHRLWEARRRLYTVAEKEEEARQLLLEDAAAVDGDDIAAALEAAGKVEDGEVGE